MRKIMTSLAVLLLAICRTVYCWAFLILSLFMIHAVYSNILRMARLHLVEKGDIPSNIICATYSIILSIAWWMIFRGKPAIKQWAVAANLVLIFTYLVPALLYWNWQYFLKAEHDWWPVILIGIFGTIIFTIPYHGWRHKSQIPVK